MSRTDEHETVTLEGWTQGGTIADGGYKYGVWSKQVGRTHASIQQGLTGPYWVRVGNTMHGSRKTLKGAERLANKAFEQAIKEAGVDMDWVRKTHPDYIKGMKQHAAELEVTDTRHLYGAAINRINLLMEHIEAQEAELQWLQNQHVRVCSSEGKLKVRNAKGAAAIKRMLPKLREHFTEEYIVYELIRGGA